MGDVECDRLERVLEWAFSFRPWVGASQRTLAASKLPQPPLSCVPDAALGGPVAYLAGPLLPPEVSVASLLLTPLTHVGTYHGRTLLEVRAALRCADGPSGETGALLAGWEASGAPAVWALQPRGFSPLSEGLSALLGVFPEGVTANGEVLTALLRAEAGAPYDVEGAQVSVQRIPERFWQWGHPAWQASAQDLLGRAAKLN